MVNDPVGDFIVRLTNAGAVGKRVVSVPYSKLKHAVADKLVDAGYLKSAAKHGKKVKKTLEVALSYQNETHAIAGVTRLSKPGRRVYANARTLYPVKFGRGKRILSTPKGILTGEEARAQGVGGEQLFIIW